MIYTSYQKPLLGAKLNRGHPLSNGLVGCWLMNERGGSKVYDASGNGNIGTLTNLPTWENTSRGPAIAGTLDGTMYVSVANRPNILDGMSALTLCIWAKNRKTSITATGSEYLFAKMGSGNDGYSLHWDQSEDVVFGVYDAGLGDVVCTNVDALVDSNWHFWVARYDGAEMSLWKDGKKMATTAAQTGNIDVGGHPLEIGASSTVATSAWDGWIDFPMIYRRALTPSEILSLYKSPYAMFQPSRIIVKAPAAGGWKPAWGVRNRKTIGLGVI